MSLAKWAFGIGVAAAATVGAVMAVADQPVVNVYNWSDYIGPDVIASFTKETGIKVNYDLYDANETVEAKLAAGHSGYDIVTPTFAPFVARGIPYGLYAEIDRSKLKNWGNLDPEILAAMEKYDPDNRHAIPWIVGTVGLGVNVQKVQALVPGVPLNTLDLILKPENAQKLQACGITMLDSPTDIIPVVLNYIGRDPDSEKPEDLAAASELLSKVRPYIRKFDSSGYINDLANGDACLSLGYSTDIVIAGIRARDAKNGIEISYRIPREGTLQYIDAMAIPSDAQHKDQALAWIDYNLRADVMAQTANTVNGRTGVKAAAQFVRPDLLSNPEIYPPEDVLKKVFSGPVLGRAYDRLRSRAWTRVRSGQ